ncbi:MAG: DNA methyltransferase, partial [Bacteroidota bacterium]|nr:DNA methyltransferase [Bacteroidota bacterium]
ADTFKERLELGLIEADFVQGKVQVFEKYRENQVIKTHWTESKYHAIHYGTNLLKSILGETIFDFPKSLYLVEDTLKLLTKPNSLVLDFFAGSGTTLHATMQLNNEDGGNRQCILVTNNENNICEEVTYERNKRVIQGYTNAKGEWTEGLKKNNLRYYKCKGVGRERTLRNKKTLVALSCGMLNIKENIYKEEKTFGALALRENKCRYFAEGERRMLVIIDEEWIERIVEQLKEMEVKERVKVYVFSNGSYAWDDDFEEVGRKVDLCALPEAIYNAYRNILPKREDKIIETGEEKPLTAEQEEEIINMYKQAEEE